MKRFLKLLISISLIAFVMLFKVFAYDINKDDKIYVSGAPIGIKLNTGVTIAGTYAVAYNNHIYKPWSNAKLLEGDIIINYDNNEIKTLKDLEFALSKSKAKKSDIIINRNGKTISSVITPVVTDKGISLGLYIKENIMGVGTLTYYLEEAKIFGSLGHKITDYSLNDGEIYEASIKHIVKPRANEAGEKEAIIYDKPIGFIKKNSITGVHGNSNSLNLNKMEYLNFKMQDEVNCGYAEIWTCIDGTNIEKFAIDIFSLESQKDIDIKGITFRVTDDKLINKCGGIVQGMSGSPIVQDNKIIGAVTHVSLANPTVANGIYIEWMLKDMGINVK